MVHKLLLLYLDHWLCSISRSIQFHHISLRFHLSYLSSSFILDCVPNLRILTSWSLVSSKVEPSLDHRTLMLIYVWAYELEFVHLLEFSFFLTYLLWFLSQQLIWESFLQFLPTILMDYIQQLPLIQKLMLCRQLVQVPFY